MKRNRIIVIACVTVLAVLCFPLRFSYKDGGTVEYLAVLYRVTFYHAIAYEGTDENGDVWFASGSERVKAKPGEWWVFGGTEVQICGFTVYDNTGLRKVADAPEAESEQTPAPTAETIVIPKDQRGVELALKAETWGDWICVIPKTFTVTDATETEFVAKAETEADLLELRYVLVPYAERWAFEAALQDPDTFEKESGHEITAGCSGTYLYHRDSVVCFAPTLYLENEICVVIGKALSEEGIDEFDSTVRRFVAIDARRKADAMGEGINPFFTCTGTEYGEFPLVLKADCETELLAFLRDNRDLLERAAAELLEHPQMRILFGKASMLNEAGTQYEPVDAASLSDDLRTLLQLSKDRVISEMRVHAPEPLFAEDASQYVILEFPRAIDTTYDVPGILYNYSLVFTTNTPEQLVEVYKGFLTPIEDHWYLALNELAY